MKPHPLQHSELIHTGKDRGRKWVKRVVLTLAWLGFVALLGELFFNR